MPIETAPYIGSLVPANPLDTDQEGQGAAQIRLVKSAVQASFPNVNGAVSATDVQLSEAGGAYQIDGFYLPLPPGTTDGNQGGRAVMAVAGAAGAFQGFIQTYENAVAIGLQTAPVITSTSSTNTVTGLVTTTQTLTTAASPLSALTVDEYCNVSVAASGTQTISNPRLFLNGTSVSDVGDIKLWYGSSTAIPAGWHICDGTNGTPDLRGKFVVGADLGAGSSYPPGYSGGNAFLALSASNLPSHTHAIYLDDPGHTHVVYDPGHTHGLPGQFWEATGASGGIDVDNGSGQTHSEPATIAVAGTGISLDVGTTGISAAAGYTGSGVPLDNRPPFLALMYIMRIA